MSSTSLIIVLIILITFYFYVYRYSYMNTKTVMVGDEDYQVHRQHHNPEGAAKLLDEIVRRNKILLDHLSMKYAHSNLKDNLNPDKENRIDAIPFEGDSDIRDAVIQQMGYLQKDVPYLSQRVIQLSNNYRVDEIYEISPLNSTGATSYTENKGEKLVLCLRKKVPNGENIHEFHDINTLMFVVLHELTHIMNDRWGHKEQYWRMFKFIVLNAVEAGIYIPVDYAKNSKVYCGMDITYNPFFDQHL